MSTTETPRTDLPAHRCIVTRADVIAYAAASGDLNPIHWSDRMARAAGLPGVVAPGMLTMAVAARAIEGWLGPGWSVRELRAAFARPVVVPDDDAGVEIVVAGSLETTAGDGHRIRFTAAVDGVTVLSRASAVVAAIDDGGAG